MNLREFLEQADTFEGISVRDRLEAWQKIADHPFFSPAYYSQDTLISAMLKMLDNLVEAD